MRRHFLVATLVALLPISVLAAETATVSLDVQGMTCSACPFTLRQVLKQQPGVTDVKVDYKSHTALITFDPAKAKIESIAQASAEAGFPATVLK